MHSLWEKTLNSTLGDNFRKTNIKDINNINVIPSPLTDVNCNFLVVSVKMRMLSTNLIQVSVGGFDY